MRVKHVICTVYGLYQLYSCGGYLDDVPWTINIDANFYLLIHRKMSLFGSVTCEKIFCTVLIWYILF